MKSQDVKESHFEAIKILTDLEGNLSTCHYFAILSNGFGGRIQGLKPVCFHPQLVGIDYNSCNYSRIGSCNFL